MCDNKCGTVFPIKELANEVKSLIQPDTNINLDDVAKVCENLGIRVIQTTNGQTIEGVTNLKQLAEKVSLCLGLDARLEDIEKSLSVLQEQSAQDVVSITPGPDGKLIYTLRGGTKTTLQIDTDQVTKVSENSNEIVYTNEDGTQFKVTATAIKRLIANDYVDNDELVNALSPLDPDQVTKFAITGTNLIITNEDGSSVSVKRTDMVNWLNAGLATDVELANAITSIDTDQAKLELESSDLKLTNEAGTSSSVSLSALTKALRGGDGINTSNGEVNVCLSRDDGNLLELREDPDTGEVCLYFGVQAPADVSNLFVKATGDDSAIGSRDAPLRTLREALSRSPSDKSNTINLYAGDTFVLDEGHVSSGAIKRLIRPYGGEFTPDSSLYVDVRAKNVVAYWYRSTNFVRPKIITKWKKIPFKSGEAQIIDSFRLANGANLYIQGCEIVLSPPEYNEFDVPSIGINGASFVYGSGSVNLDGVVINDTYSQNKSLFSGLSVSQNIEFRFNSCRWEGADNRNIDPYKSAFNFRGSSSIIASDANNISTPEIESEYGLTRLNTNITTEIKKPMMVVPIVRDSSGTVINIQSNVNL